MAVRRFVNSALLSATALGSCVALSTAASAAPQSEFQITNQTEQHVIQSRQWGTEDEFYYQQIAPSNSEQALPFSNETVHEDVFDALGYMPTKAPPLSKAPAAPASNVTVGAWVSSTADFENQTGTFLGANLGARTQTYTTIGGVDFVKTHIFTASDALLFGFLGGGTEAFTQPSAAGAASTKTRAGTVGMYGAYLPGDFSTDWSLTVSPTNSVTGGLVPASTNVTSYSFSNNYQYRFTLPSKWWLEPTAGYSYTDGVWSTTQRNAGFLDNIVWRLQGGLRAGTSIPLGNGISIQPAFTGLVYSDVKVMGTSTAPALAGFPTAPTDQGQLWGKGDAKVTFAFPQNFSAFVEGEVHGTGNNGTGTSLGGSATVGVRKTW